MRSMSGIALGQTRVLWLNAIFITANSVGISMWLDGHMDCFGDCFFMIQATMHIKHLNYYFMFYYYLTKTVKKCPGEISPQNQVNRYETVFSCSQTIYLFISIHCFFFYFLRQFSPQILIIVLQKKITYQFLTSKQTNKQTKKKLSYSCLSTCNICYTEFQLNCHENNITMVLKTLK